MVASDVFPVRSVLGLGLSLATAYDPINFEECPLTLSTGNGKTQLTIEANYAHQGHIIGHYLCPLRTPLQLFYFCRSRSSLSHSFTDLWHSVSPTGILHYRVQVVFTRCRFFSAAFDAFRFDFIHIFCLINKNFTLNCFNPLKDIIRDFASAR